MHTRSYAARRDTWPKTLAGWLAQMRDTSAALFWTGVALLVMSCFTLILLQTDTRLFQGVSVWLKPWKFQVSVGIYLLTLCVFLMGLPEAERRGFWVHTLARTAVFCGVFEVLYISWQGMLGLASHFNRSSEFYIAMYRLMGVGAALLTTSSLVLAAVIARSVRYRAAGVVKLGIVVGLVLTWVLGLGFGAYMSAQPTGHLVGALVTDTGGLPVVNWSRSAGDLRVPHFFGIHAMHFVPLAAWLVSLTRLKDTSARRLLWVFAAAYVALTVATFVQAGAGNPFVANSNNLETDKLAVLASHMARF
ncbi:MAG: hypothetical protein ACK5YJ_02675 [Curvibacter sp.]|jgi:hypothetical protein|nr:hypothetical protein [Curvibacter sp.]